MLTPEQIMLVQSSWEEIEPLTGRLGKAFYEKLFELDPSLEKLFEGDLRKQGETLMSMMSLAVEMLDRPESLQGTMDGLGRRHAGYGVRPGNFAVFKESLMWALSVVLGPSFEGDLREAWGAMYDLLAEMMHANPAE